MTTDHRRRPKLGVVSTHPIQYQVPLWRKLAERPDLDLQVYFGSDFSSRSYVDQQFGISIEWDVPLLGGYEHCFLSRDPTVTNSRSLRATGLRRLLVRDGITHLLIHGYMPMFWWDAAWAGWSLGLPILLRTEANDEARDRSPAKAWLRHWMLRLFYSRCSKVLAIGQRAKTHFERRGVPSSKIGWAPYCADSDLMALQAGHFLPQRDQLRAELGFGREDVVLVFCGKLIEKKDPLTLGQALLALDESTRSRLGLVVMGEGALRPQFQAMCEQALGDRCRFLGFMNQSSLGRVYSLGDALVLPSKWGETWGVVVNEGMQFGLVPILSSRVGCAADLVPDESTGFVFECGNHRELAEKIRQFVEMPRAVRDSARANCASRIARYSSDAAVAGIVAAVSSLA